jgi:hypothetical protein
VATQTVKVFRNKSFTRFANKAGITDADLRKCINDADRGLIDADLGGDVIKQRIARPGQGKSGGFRAIIIIHLGERAFFVHGFAKNELANITQNELIALRLLAVDLLAYSDEELKAAVDQGVFTEVSNEETVSE